mmetsp:Transcript_5194/g.14676  ORF Transcript_5194/g.14676 Transcript_5194/m.14676 type:complete len:410 (+) Transcript_5194:88-1317(+)
MGAPRAPHRSLDEDSGESFELGTWQRDSVPFIERSRSSSARDVAPASGSAAGAPDDPLRVAQGRGPAEPQPIDSILVANSRIEVWSDGVHSQLRARHGIHDKFLESLSMDRLMPKVSKSGANLYLTEDDEYCIKGLHRVEHESLLSFAQAYAERRRRGSSLLATIYLHFRFATVGTVGMQWASFIAMKNLTPRIGTWEARYDLKACDDDKTLEVDGRKVVAVHRRFWRADMWCRCAWTELRWEYYRGKERARTLRVKMAETQHRELIRMLRADVDLLVSHGLMDYSLVLGIQRFPSTFAGSTPPAPEPGRINPVRQFSALDESGAVQVVTMGIIDFLQTWTLKKRVASYCKVLERDKATVDPRRYGRRFLAHFEQLFVPSSVFVALPLPHSAAETSPPIESAKPVSDAA